ncbi:MAG: NAD(+)/NADH kinase [Proteobacteria bacterium]|nr:NAD(+)/NADH kinase [Pseudomonadota bacterium]
MKKIGIIVKISNPEAIKTGEQVCKWLTKRGVEVYVEKAIGDDVRCATALDAEDIPTMVDAIVVLGGDGTLLHVVRLLKGGNVPILGVNQGGLGFLTAINVDEIYTVLERMLEGDYRTAERMMLTVDVVRDGKVVSSHRVLNDAVIKATGARLALLKTSINKEYVTTYRADGLIIATPTGSTAYSLSAAGPILYPTIHSITVSPICPFNLTNRPVVIPDWMNVEVTIPEGQRGIVLTLDGQADVELEENDKVEIKRDNKSVFLVKFEGKSYFEILRERLMWEIK